METKKEKTKLLFYKFFYEKRHIFHEQKIKSLYINYISFLLGERKKIGVLLNNGL